MVSPHLAGMTVCPVTSFAGHALDAMDVEVASPQGDRRWMIVDRSGSTITARSHPHLLAARAAPERCGAVTLCSYGCRWPARSPWWPERAR
ncbi:MOSC N-terminal beta barrel domain-containing protein [Cellulomonas sp. URHB0016]